MKTGIELIAIERKEQIEKHGWSLEHDAEFYENGELISAAKFCEIATGRGIGYTGEQGALWPDNWDQYFRRKVLCKTKIEALIVAGAFYMAENDRLGTDNYIDDVNRIANEINNLLLIESTTCACGVSHPLVAEFGRCGKCMESII